MSTARKVDLIGPTRNQRPDINIPAFPNKYAKKKIKSIQQLFAKCKRCVSSMITLYS